MIYDLVRTIDHDEIINEIMNLGMHFLRFAALQWKTLERWMQCVSDIVLILNSELNQQTSVSHSRAAKKTIIVAYKQE